MQRTRAGDFIFAIAALVIGFCACRSYFGSAINATIVDRIRTGTTFEEVMTILDAPPSNVKGKTWDEIRASFKRDRSRNAKRLHSLTWDCGAGAAIVFFDDNGRVDVAVYYQRTAIERLRLFWTERLRTPPPF